MLVSSVKVAGYGTLTPCVSPCHAYKFPVLTLGVGFIAEPP